MLIMYNMPGKYLQHILAKETEIAWKQTVQIMSKLCGGDEKVAENQNKSKAEKIKINWKKNLCKELGMNSAPKYTKEILKHS